MVENHKSLNGLPSSPKIWWHIPENIDNAVSLKEAAKKLCLHYTTVRLQIMQGKLNGFKIGRNWYVILPK